MALGIDPPDARTLLDAARKALAACSDGFDALAVQPETPLAVLVFDSLMAVNFIATLEAVLGVTELPFEQWIAEHSENTGALTIGSLVDWLRSLPQVTAPATGEPRTGRHRAAVNR